jgi:hypothetical protein
MFQRPGELSWSVIDCRTDIVRAGVVVLPLQNLVYLLTRSLILNRRLTEFSIRLLFTSLRRHKESRCWGYNKFSRCPSLLVNVRHHGSNGIYRWMQRSPPRNLPVGTASTWHMPRNWLYHFVLTLWIQSWQIFLSVRYSWVCIRNSNVNVIISVISSS